MYNIRVKQVTIGLVFVLTLAMADFAQSPTEQQPGQASEVASGQKQKVSGVIIDQNAESLVIRDEVGANVNVLLTDNTRVRQHKKKTLGDATPQLMHGLFIEVEGRTNNSGYLVAERIRFSKRALMIASAIRARVDLVERRISANEANAEEQMAQNEVYAEEQAARIEGSTAVALAARREARAAQQAAAVAVVGVMSIANGIDEVISGLDQYEVTKSAAVNFTFGSDALSPQAKAALKGIAEETREKEGYLIEVEGFASSEGNVDHNRQLSRRRAEAVVAYLVGIHQIPPRRIIAAVGLGSANPITDDSSREGRGQNRRVEVKMLVNRSLGSPAPEDRQ